MTNEQILQALKDNTSAFGLMPKELQDKAREIGGIHFIYCASDGWNENRINWKFDCPSQIYRLRPDYIEEPEEIELEIRANSAGDLCLWLGRESNIGLYTSAPALCPKPGYRFVGYRYEGEDELHLGAARWKNWGRINSSVLFPIAAIYWIAWKARKV